jgi:hypothetical protein
MYGIYDRIKIDSELKYKRKFIDTLKINFYFKHKKWSITKFSRNLNLRNFTDLQLSKIFGTRKYNSKSLRLNWKTNINCQLKLIKQGNRIE